MPRFHKILLGFFSAWCCSLGCSLSSPTLYPVSGKVSVDGNPLQAGSVVLHPESDQGGQGPLIAGGKIKNGEYEIYTGQQQGAVAGLYKVLVISTTASGNSTPPTGGTIPTPKSLIDPKYGKPESTPLRFEVVARPDVGAYDLEVTK